MSNNQQQQQQNIAQAAAHIASADKVLIVAGAGMSVGQGKHDYGRSFISSESFDSFYPGIREATGVRNCYEATLGGKGKLLPR